MEELLDNKS